MAVSKERIDGDDDRYLRELSNELKATARTGDMHLGGRARLKDDRTGFSETKGRLHVSIETAPDIFGDKITVPNTIPEEWIGEDLVCEVEVRVKRPIED